MSRIKASFLNLDILQGFLIENGVPFASYRLPDEASPITLISSGAFKRSTSISETIKNDKTFLMAPFYPEADIVSFIPEFEIKGHNFDTFTLETNKGKPDLPFYDDLSLDAETYQKKITSVILQIKQGRADKVVVSRTIETKALKPDETPALFHLLCQLQPQSYVYLAYFPGMGLWAGATPELLLRAEAGQVHTVALAATKRADSATNWAEKEIDEQAWVSKHVLECLTKTGCENIEVSKIRTIKAGNAAHLMTPFSAQVQHNMIPTLIETLHPTPAICGWPRDVARQMIRESENYDRGFYTGYLGTLDNQGNAALYVNLRCLQVFNNKTVIYAGGGITAGSDPHAEWEETELKTKNMLSAIEKLRNLATPSEKQRNEQ